MTNSEFADMIKVAEIVSKKFGTSWLMSDGKEIKVAYNEREKEFEENHGFWVAVIFENGHIVEA